MGGPPVDGLRPIDRYSFEPPILFQLKNALSTRSWSEFGTPVVEPSELRLVGCPLNTCTPVESPKTLYMLSLPVNDTLSATLASMFRRSRLVKRASLLSLYAGVKVEGINMPNNCCCSGAGNEAMPFFRLSNVRLLVKNW